MESREVEEDERSTPLIQIVRINDVDISSEAVLNKYFYSERLFIVCVRLFIFSLKSKIKNTFLKFRLIE